MGQILKLKGRIIMNIGRTVIIAGIGLLAVLFIGNMWYQKGQTEAEIMANDISELTSIFQQINSHCMITGFDLSKNSINFLNVKEFAGSEVGPMNLAYPKKWQGPYMKDNPTVQSIEYQIVRTNQGYYIIPGDGVKLPNGKVVGTDITINADTDMNKLMTSEDGFKYKKLILASPLSFIQTKEQYMAKVISD